MARTEIRRAVDQVAYEKASRAAVEGTIRQINAGRTINMDLIQEGDHLEWKDKRNKWHQVQVIGKIRNEATDQLVVQRLGSRIATTILPSSCRQPAISEGLAGVENLIELRRDDQIADVIKRAKNRAAAITSAAENATHMHKCVCEVCGKTRFIANDSVADNVTCKALQTTCLDEDDLVAARLGFVILPRRIVVSKKQRTRELRRQGKREIEEEEEGDEEIADADREEDTVDEEGRNEEGEARNSSDNSSDTSTDSSDSSNDDGDMEKDSLRYLMTNQKRTEVTYSHNLAEDDQTTKIFATVPIGGSKVARVC